MNKRPIFILSFLILALILAACSNGDSEDNSTEKDSGESSVLREERAQEQQELPADLQPMESNEEVDTDDAFAASEAESFDAPAGVVVAAPAQSEISAPSVAAEPIAVGTPAPSSSTAEDMFFEDYGVNPFHDTEDDHLSTFAMDVDTASYTLTRSYLQDYGSMPPADAIRPEEFINYFDVNYPSPEEGAFAIHMTAAPAPFGYENHYLLRVGLQGRYVAPEDRPAALLMFVIDVSGSMDMENRLELVKQSLALLVDQLREDDRVGIAVYSDNSRVVLEPTPASEKQAIMDAINALQPEGSTNVEAGLRLGYEMAETHMREDQITHVIVLSDGVGNVGDTSPNGILARIQNSVDKGITLSTIGFGMGNYNDVMMEQIANDGNGNYYYVDNLREARRVFVHNLTGTLQVIAYDAKVQVDFNPEITDRYRLIGYENRAVADDDFRNDDVDAGEVGAGHSITALYELALDKDLSELSAEDVIATAYIRYEDADSREVEEHNQAFTVDQLITDFDEVPADFRLQAAVAEFAELLRESYWAQEGNYVDLLDIANAAVDDLPDADESAQEFIELVKLAGRYIDTASQ